MWARWSLESAGGFNREEGLSLESVKRNVEACGVEEGLCNEELLRQGSWKALPISCCKLPR